MQLDDGRVQNMMRMRIQNRGNEARTFTLQAMTAGDEVRTAGQAELRVEPGAIKQMPLLLIRPADAEGDTFKLRVVDDEGHAQQVESPFLCLKNGGGS